MDGILGHSICVVGCTARKGRKNLFLDEVVLNEFGHLRLLGCSFPAIAEADLYHVRKGRTRNNLPYLTGWGILYPGFKLPEAIPALFFNKQPP